MKNLTQSDFLPGSTTQRQRGFNLIELMIVIVILGVILAVAIPQYTASTMKARRTDAKTALLDLAAREEKYYSINNTYTATLSNLYGSSVTGTTLTVQSGSTSYYTLSVPTVTAASSASATAAYYQGQAAPSGSQANDACGTFYIDSTGTTTVSGTPTNCW